MEYFTSSLQSREASGWIAPFFPLCHIILEINFSIYLIFYFIISISISLEVFTFIHLSFFLPAPGYMVAIPNNNNPMRFISLWNLYKKIKKPRLVMHLLTLTSNKATNGQRWDSNAPLTLKSCSFIFSTFSLTLVNNVPFL